jgi:hypothetical protein
MVHEQRVSGRASALLGGAGRSLASHRLPLDGGPTYLHEQYGRLNEEAVELVKQLAHRETALRLGLGAGEREANTLYGATFGAVLANSRKLLSAGLAKQNAEAVIRGYKGATLYADPGDAVLEGLEGAAVVDFALGGAGAGAGGGDGAAGGDVGGGAGSAA